MDAFPDGGFVRLESRALKGKFVHADEDWEKVSLLPNGAAPARNAVWRVQHRVGEGYVYFLLQNAAYGRYLSYSTKKAKFGHRGRRATQRNYSEPSAGFDPRFHRYPWMWTVQRLPAPNQAYVSLRSITYYLCANRKFVLSAWNNSVTADLESAMPWVRTMMHWRVHPVAESLVPQPLPIVLEDQGDDNAQMYPHPPRTIRHVQANDEGEFDQNHHNWDSFAFYESSVMTLKDELRQIQGWNGDMAAYTLCMRPGSHGRLMPLVTDHVPGGLDSMNIVVFRTGTPGDYSAIFSAVLRRYDILLQRRMLRHEYESGTSHNVEFISSATKSI